MHTRWIAVALAGVLAAGVMTVQPFPTVAQQASLRMISTTGGSGRFFAAMVNDFERESGLKVDLIQYPYAGHPRCGPLHRRTES